MKNLVLLLALSTRSFVSQALANPTKTPTRAQTDQPTLAQLILPVDDNAWVSHQFIVHLKDGHTPETHWLNIGVDLSKVAERFSFMHHSNMYLCKVADDSIIHDKILKDPGVQLVEQDQYLNYTHDQTLGEPFTIHYDPNTTSKVQGQFQDGRQLWTSNGSWFHAMVSAGVRLHTPIPEAGNDFWMISNPTPGDGVRVYVVDTGIMASHDVFKDRGSSESRVRNFKDLKESDKSPFCNETMKDTVGHGTYVGGIIAGIAPKATIVSVKAVGIGSSAGTLAEAINAITEEHAANKRVDKSSGFKGSVINTAFVMSPTTGLEKALHSAERNGIAIVAAAGNDNTDTSVVDGPSPCIYGSVYCVGSIDSGYAKSSFSNYGKAVDGFAPGEHVLSASIEGNDKWTKASGTSSASPFVSAIMATYISVEGDFFKVGRQVYSRLVENSLFGLVMELPMAGLSRTPNRLVTTGLNNFWKNPRDPYRGPRTDGPVYAEETNGSTPCHIAVMESWTCEPPTANLYASIMITDDNGTLLWSSDRKDDKPGVPINAWHPLQIDNSSMSHSMVLFGQHDPDHIRFYYGDFEWTSDTTQGDNRCELRGADWNKNGPKDCKQSPLYRSFGCQFIC